MIVPGLVTLVIDEPQRPKRTVAREEPLPAADRA